MTHYEIGRLQEFLASKIETVDFASAKASFIPVDVLKILPKAFDDVPYVHSHKLSDDYDMDDLVTLLSDGLSMQCGFVSVDYDQLDYKAARQHLVDAGFGLDDIVHELVQAQMVIEGKRLVLIDEDNIERQLTVAKVVKGLDKAVADFMKEYGCGKLEAICKFFDEGDFFDFNGALQYATLGRKIYG